MIWRRIWHEGEARGRRNQGRRRWRRIHGVRARGRLGRRLEMIRKPPTKAPGHGLYAPAAGSPDALNVAPDTFGDHRTHAQRGLQIGTAPDDGHRMLALASGASGHAR